MRTLLLSSLVMFAACCTSKEATADQSPSAPPPAPAPKKAPLEGSTTVKPGAPTTLEAQVDGARAKLSLRFEGAGEDVVVRVSGLEGVNVSTGGEWLAGASVKAGEVREHTVTFTTSGRGHLVVSVEGRFPGLKARVHTVAVGEGPVKDLGTVQQTTDGDSVKVMP